MRSGRGVCGSTNSRNSRATPNLGEPLVTPLLGHTKVRCTTSIYGQFLPISPNILVAHLFLECHGYIVTHNAPCFGAPRLRREPPRKPSLHLAVTHHNFGAPRVRCHPCRAAFGWHGYLSSYKAFPYYCCRR